MALPVFTDEKKAVAAILGTETTIYTVPVGKVARLVSFSGANTAAAKRYITFHVVDSGGSAGTTNVFGQVENVLQEADGANELSGGLIQWEGGIPLVAGDKISAIADDTGITVTLIYLEGDA